MKAIKKYLLIALGLLVLYIFSSINQGKREGPCCPFSIKQSNNNPGGENNE
jgi:hypothetical protein